MRNKLLYLIFLFCYFNIAQAQDTWLEGKVTDKSNNEPLAGVTISIDNYGTISQNNGKYILKVQKTGTQKVTYRFIGFEIIDTLFQIKEGKNILNVELQPKLEGLNTVVISAGKYTQNINEVSVSMEVVKTEKLSQNSSVKLDDALDRINGVSVISGQANIRGSSGYTYGAGSRVMLMVDEMPLLSADAGDVKWSYIPMENISQVEVIKGAASALFGSSALGGVIHIRTQYPSDTPITKISLQTTAYGEQKSKYVDPFSNFISQQNLSFVHSRKIKKLDWVLSGNALNNPGYRIADFTKRVRISNNLRYRISDRLSISLNATAMLDTTGVFLFWANRDSAFFPSGGTIGNQKSIRYNIDPIVTYYDKDNNKHTFRNRIFLTDNQSTAAQSSKAILFYNEYAFQKTLQFSFAEKSVLNAGVLSIYNQINGGQLYGNRKSENVAVYAQLDQKVKNLNYTLGYRFETFQLEDNALNKYGLLRAGANYKLKKATFLRGSIGQGYRNPSVAEKYVSISGNGLLILPNPDLRPEKGLSSEIGVKQIIKFNNWIGMADLAFFRTAYQNMIEFSFGWSAPQGIGFKAVNTTSLAVIRGSEISILLANTKSRIKPQFNFGYTFMDPKDLSYRTSDTVENHKYLKYRYKHLIRCDFSFQYKKITFGLNTRYNSFMLRIDEEFNTLIPGVKEFRENKNMGDLIFDTRVFWNSTSNFQVGLVLRNLSNNDFMVVPGNISEPRNLSLQLNYKF